MLDGKVHVNSPVPNTPAKVPKWTCNMHDMTYNGKSAFECLSGKGFNALSKLCLRSSPVRPGSATTKLVSQKAHMCFRFSLKHLRAGIFSSTKEKTDK